MLSVGWNLIELGLQADSGREEWNFLGARKMIGISIRPAVIQG
jgi:hypothetical protein